VPFRAMRLSRARRETAEDVLVLGDGLKVFRVHATTDTAQVVDLMTLGDRSVYGPICDAVRVVLAAAPLSGSGGLARDCEQAVAGAGLAAGPQPATRLINGHSLGRKPEVGDRQGAHAATNSSASSLTSAAAVVPSAFAIRKRFSALSRSVR